MSKDRKRKTLFINRCTDPTSVTLLKFLPCEVDQTPSYKKRIVYWKLKFLCCLLVVASRISLQCNLGFSANKCVHFSQFRMLNRKGFYKQRSAKWAIVRLIRFIFAPDFCAFLMNNALFIDCKKIVLQMPTLAPFKCNDDVRPSILSSIQDYLEPLMFLLGAVN